jgi:hypothetical protein
VNRDASLAFVKHERDSAVHMSVAAKAASTEVEQAMTSFSRERAQALWQAARSYILLRVEVDQELNHLDGRTEVVRVTMGGEERETCGDWR